MNKDVSEKVIELLNEQILVQTRVSEVSKSIQTAICSREIPAIESALREFDRLTVKSDELERDRIEAISKCEDIPNNKRRLTQILPFLPKDSHKKLLSLKSKLQTILLENNKINTSNQIHLEANLESIHSLVLSLSGASTKSLKYSSVGKGEQGVRRNLLNRVG
jgi:flagellar biosynthesis/type III secretory pathway chaperone